MLRNVQISLLGENEIAREGLRKILSSENFNIRESFSDVGKLVTALHSGVTAGELHVIIVDHSHRNVGLDACRTLAAVKGDSRLVLLAEQYVFEDVAEAFQVGVDGVIIKEISCEPLIESIMLVALGEKVFPSQLANNLTTCTPTVENGDWRASAASVGLSAREIEILESIMAGMANKVIARQFDICEATVKVHVKAILRKLDVDNRTQAATWAVKQGIGNITPLGLADVKSAPVLVAISSNFGRAA